MSLLEQTEKLVLDSEWSNNNSMMFTIKDQDFVIWKTEMKMNCVK